MLNNIKDEDIKLLNINLDNHPKNILCRYFYIPSNLIRPDLRITPEKTSTDQITVFIQMIIKTNETIVPVSKDSITIDENNLKNIKIMNSLIINLHLGGQQVTNVRGNKLNYLNNFKSILERFKGKEGIIRKNILGRRIHGMFRSVIVCDHTLPLDHIKIPLKFAKEISIKEIVNDMNKDKLLRYVQNGIDIYPGATKIIKKSTNIQLSLAFAKNVILENGDIIYRNLIDGDVIYFNRQPSVIYCSMMAVKVIIDVNPNCLIISMNVIICDFFGADFDGDQMSGIVLNSFISRNEAWMLGNLSEFSISKQTSTTCLGQTYDSIIGSFLTTREKVILSKKNACNILSNIGSLNNKLITRFFNYFNNDNTISGRNLMSIAIPENINLTTIPKWYDKEYDKPEIHKYLESEKKVIIKNGTIISGVLDGTTIKSKGGSLYHTINTEKGKKETIESVYNMQQIAINYMLYEAFSISIKDVLVSIEAIKELRNTHSKKILEELNDLKDKIIDGTLDIGVGMTKLNILDDQYKKIGRPKYTDLAKYINFEKNNIMKLGLSGSSGKCSISNIYQMITTIGFKVVNKAEDLIQNNKFSYSRTTVYFQRFDFSPQSKGYCINSYFNGINSSELTINSMNARYDLMEQALTTADTGTISRKTVKHMESIVVNNIRLIRNNNHIIQYLYGDNSIDNINTFPVNISNIIKLTNDEFKKKFACKSDEEIENLLKYKKIISEIAINYSQINLKNNINDIFTINIPFNPEMILENYRGEKSETDSNLNIMRKKINDFCSTLKYIYFNNMCKENKIYLPDIYEKSTFTMELIIKIYLSTAYLINYKISIKDIDNILQNIELKILKSLIAPGTPIGIITSVCITEPVIQIALDATRGEGLKTGLSKNNGNNGIKKNR